MRKNILLDFKNIIAVLFTIVLLSGCIAGSSALVDGKKAYSNKDYPTAVTKFNEGAAEGDAEAQYWMSIIYSQGSGVEKNEAEALKWVKMSAESGYALAQIDLGLRYLEGKSLKKDDNEAFKWIKMAADQENPTGLATLGIMYNHGMGVKADKAMAKQYYLKAKEKGFPVPDEALNLVN